MFTGMKKIAISRFITVILFSSLCLSGLRAQSVSGWQGRKCAVVLTYDDGLNIDLSNVVPVLDSMHFRGTFYISDHANKLPGQIDGWRKAAAEGHELANHTVYHPCLADIPGRSWVQPDRDMSRYTVKRINEEMRTMNTMLQAIDGRRERTFAYPCGDTKIHDTSYIDPMRKEFIAARGTKAEMLPVEKIDLYNIGCYGMNGQSGADMIALVKKAMASGTLLVFLFHGVGGEHDLNVSLQAHSELLHFLKENQKDIWIAPLLDVAKWIRSRQAQL